jgi:hypothetical protein
MPPDLSYDEALNGPPPDTGAMLDSLATILRRFVVLSDAQRDALALWVPHTHTIAAADTTPYISISSAEKQSGKSRLLEVLAQLVARPMEAANVSDAALFRALAGEAGPATLLYDEVDTIFGKNASTAKEEQRGLLNAGYRRGAVAWRCEGEGSKQTVKPYPVFGPKACPAQPGVARRAKRPRTGRRRAAVGNRGPSWSRVARAGARGPDRPPPGQARRVGVLGGAAPRRCARGIRGSGRDSNRRLALSTEGRRRGPLAILGQGRRWAYPAWAVESAQALPR